MRVYYLHLHVVILEMEGSGYAHQAENLVNGRGFESYLYARPDLEHCWLQSVLIAAISLVTHDLDGATHAVSLASGVLLIVWLFLITNRFYGIWSAWVAAILAAFHPLLIALSTSGYAEALAIALQLGAIYWSIRFFEDEGRWSWLFAGCLWGLSYLNRTECLVLPVATTAVYLLRVAWMRQSFRRWARQSLLFLAVFALVASPYVLFFYDYTGKVRFEGKNLLNYTIGQRELQGMNLDVAERELTPALQELGPSLNTSAYTTYSPYPTHFRDLANYFFRMAHRNMREVLYTIVEARYLGGKPLTLLVILGLLGGSWSAKRFFRELFLIGLFGYLIILFVASHNHLDRYTFLMLPFLLIWASTGIARFVSAIQWRLEEVGAGARIRVWSATLAAIFFALIILRGPAKTVDYMWDFTSGWAPNGDQKEAGYWLRSADPGLKTTYGTASLLLLR